MASPASGGASSEARSAAHGRGEARRGEGGVTAPQRPPLSAQLGRAQQWDACLLDGYRSPGLIAKGLTPTRWSIWKRVAGVAVSALAEPVAVHVLRNIASPGGEETPEDRRAEGTGTRARSGSIPGAGAVSADPTMRLQQRPQATLAKSALLLVQVAQLLNFVYFLRSGKYPTLTHRILGLSSQSSLPGLQYADAAASLLAANALLSALGDFVKFLQGFADWRDIFHSLRRAFKRLLFWLMSKWQSKAAGMRALDTAPRETPESTECCYCGLEHAVVPRRLPCGHVYCYVCLESMRRKPPYDECTVCGLSLAS